MSVDGMVDDDERHLIEAISRSALDDREKGIDVRKQLQVYGKIIELRLALFEAQNLSNELPAAATYSELLELDSTEKVVLSEAIDSACREIDLSIRNLITIWESLVRLNHSLLSEVDKNESPYPWENADSAIDLNSKVDFADDILEDWRAICIRRAWEESVMSRLGASALGLTSIRGHTYTLIEQSLKSDLDHLIRITKVPRSRVKVIGDLASDFEAATDATSMNCADTYPDTYDDTGTYNQLIRSLLELQKYITTDPSCISIVNLSKKIQEHVKRKNVDACANKDKRIRYNTHDKISSFVAPRARRRNNLDPESTCRLFSALFSA